MSVKKIIFLVFGLTLLALLAFYFFGSWPAFSGKFLSPLGSSQKPTPTVARPLDQYAFEALRQRPYPSSEIKLEHVISQEAAYTSWLFSYLSDGQRVTGMANLPEGKGPFSVVIMLRGHVDDEVYFTGVGTHKAAGVLAANGFLTLAPDFLGFGGSDSSSADILEARFTRPVTVLNLLAAIKSLPQADETHLGLWAHSNGGQIALSVLEISQRALPTTLWAPVTKGFPESVLTFMGEMDDQWFKVKKALADFAQLYDSQNYSIDHYFGDITAPMQLHQGGQDALVPASWSQAFVERMNQLGKKIDYYYYPSSDHNLKQNWDQVVARDITFFQTKLSD